MNALAWTMAILVGLGVAALAYGLWLDWQDRHED